MPRKSRKNVGLIGLGIIGTRAAAGLRAAGYQTFVWNRSPKPTPNFLASPAEVAGMCEIIQIFVADAQALFDVIEQMNDALTSRHLIICNATVGPEATIEAARLVEARGAAFLDAPFTGSKNAAEKRQLVYYLGGDEASCLRARPVLEATSRAIIRIGEIGHAATVKVVTNMIAAVSVQTLAEALAIVQKAGLDPEVLGTALEHNACRSGTMEMKLPGMIAGAYEPHFSLKHMFKDVQLGIHVANALDIEIPATTVTAGVMFGALNRGHGDLDFSVLYKAYESQGKTAAASLPAGTTKPAEYDLDGENRPASDSKPADQSPGSQAGAPMSQPKDEETLQDAAQIGDHSGGQAGPVIPSGDAPKSDTPAPPSDAKRDSPFPWIAPPKRSESAPSAEPRTDPANPSRIQVLPSELVRENADPSAAPTIDAHHSGRDEENPPATNFVRRWFAPRGN